MGAGVDRPLPAGGADRLAVDLDRRPLGLRDDDQLSLLLLGRELEREVQDLAVLHDDALLGGDVTGRLGGELVGIGGDDDLPGVGSRADLLAVDLHDRVRRPDDRHVDARRLHERVELQRDGALGATGELDRLDRLSEAGFHRANAALAELHRDRTGQLRVVDLVVVDEDVGVLLAHVDRELSDESLEAGDRRLDVALFTGRELSLTFGELSLEQLERRGVAFELLLGDADVEEHARVLREVVRRLEAGTRTVPVLALRERDTGIPVPACFERERVADRLVRLRPCRPRHRGQDGRDDERDGDGESDSSGRAHHVRISASG